VLYHQRPEEMRDILLTADGDEELPCQAEQDQFGFTHASVADSLLEKWMIPEELQQAVCWHHQPERARTARFEAHILYLANLLVNESEQGNFMGIARTDIELSRDSMDEVGLNEDELYFAFEDAAEQFPAMIKSLI
jgi:HD-like signal output (HDOD) protein